MWDAYLIGYLILLERRLIGPSWTRTSAFQIHGPDLSVSVLGAIPYETILAMKIRYYSGSEKKKDYFRRKIEPASRVYYITKESSGGTIF